MISMHTSPLASPGVGDAGGLNVYVLEVARRLGERGVKVDIFTRQDHPSGPTTVEINEHARVVEVTAGPNRPLPKEQLPDLITDFVTALEHRIHEYDLLHSHYWLSGLVALDLAKRHSLPLVHTMHTTARTKNGLRGSGHVNEPLERERGEAAISAAADVLTANTTDEAAELTLHYAARPDQIAIVPPGVDLHTFHPCDQPKSRAQLGVDPEADVILFVGRVQPLKAPDVLIRAVGELVRAEPARRARLRLILIGSASGPDAEWSHTLPALAESLGLSESVEFRAHSPRDELFRWYCVSDIVGVPSFTESFGLVALEAQACGRPVVATRVGGLRHAVRDGHTGLLVAGHDPVEWAAALRTILDDRRLALRMSINAAGHAAGFSWDNTAAATLAAYHVACT